MMLVSPMVEDLSETVLAEKVQVKPHDFSIPAYSFDLGGFYFQWSLVWFDRM